MLTKDRSLAVVVIVIVAMLLVQSANIPAKTSWQPYGSALFPRLLLCVMGILATIILIKSFLRSATHSGPRVSVIAILRQKWRTIALFVLFGLYALALPYVGYVAATVAFMLAVQALLMGIDSRKKALIILGMSFTFVPLVYVIFQYGLKIWLP
jgi:putative tricarboxylic transport membrane protein